MPEMHRASVVHYIEQLWVTGSQVRGVQLVVAGLASWQVPVPSHVLGLLRVEPVQDACTHTVPDGYSRQAPAPLHVPSWPQVEVGPVVHRGSGVAAGRAWQKPTKPETLQLWQAVQGPSSQHTPSLQLPPAHSGSVVPMQLNGVAQGAVAEQVAPIPRWLQAPPLQVLGGTHSASLEQTAKHTVPLHV
jgi:hypothetical protein